MVKIAVFVTIVPILFQLIDIIYKQVGGLFKGLIRTFAPVMKRGLVALGKKALKTGVEVLHDYSQGANIKQALKRRAKENVGVLIKSSIKPKHNSSNSIRTSIVKKKGRSTSAKRPTAKHRKVQDILEDD